MLDLATWRVAFSSNLEAGLADIPAEMNALHAFFARNGIRGGWRKVGEVLDISGAYARELAQGIKPISRDLTERWLLETGRYRMMYEVSACPDCGGLHADRCYGKRITTVPACPDCGQAHTGRCHGKPVVQVVVLAPGERVTTEPTTAPKRVRRPSAGIGGLRPETRAAHDARRRALGLTWDAYLRGLLEDA